MGGGGDCLLLGLGCDEAWRGVAGRGVRFGVRFVVVRGLVSEVDRNRKG